MKSADLENTLRKPKVDLSERISLVLRLSLPAILAELTSIAMQYIDTLMVGKLGSEAMASIGLVSSTTWLIGGVCIGVASGFSVQTAQLIGAGRQKEAANVLRQSLVTLLAFGIILALFAAGISESLPRWLGGEQAIRKNASLYFLVFAISIPLIQIRQISGSMLSCSGNVKVPSIFNSLVCVLDVIFNMFFIFPSRDITLFGRSVHIYGMGLGVLGAAIGTALADGLVALMMLYYVCFCSDKLRLRKGGSWKLDKTILKNALKISVPMSFDHIFMCSAYVAGTYLIAPLGSVAVAANSLAITAESLCYMPGYGIGTAATTLVGQSIGAGKKKFATDFAYIATALGMLIMGGMAIVMYIYAPFVFNMLTTDPAAAELGIKVIRLELIAEPLYAASIVCAGAFRGSGDTLLPSIMNLLSMWGVRITLAAILVPVYGLSGYWIAMCIELCFRGTIYLIRLFRKKWLDKSPLKSTLLNT